MKCNACGAINDAHQINCSFCGEPLGAEASNFSTDIVTDEKASSFIKKSINSDGKIVLESGNVGLKVYSDGKYYNYFLSFSIIGNSEVFLNLFAVVNSKAFNWDNEYRSLFLTIKFNKNEVINFNVNYFNTTEDSQLDSDFWGKHSRVHFKVPFTKELLLKFIQSEKISLSIKGSNQSKTDKININSETIIPYCGYYNSIFNTSIRGDEVIKYWSDNAKLNLIKKKGLWLIFENNLELKKANEQLNYPEFKEWIHSNEEKLKSLIKDDENKRASENQTKENNLLELKQLKKKLSKIEDNSYIRLFMNIFLSLGLLIFLWVKIDLKTSLIIVALYNIIFTFWSKNRISTLEKSIKVLGERVK
jgi:hypothetical protein